MPEDLGPPGDGSGPAPPGEPDHAVSAAARPPNNRNTSSPMRRRNTVGRHADAWREGFGYGFRDALRLA